MRLPLVNVPKKLRTDFGIRTTYRQLYHAAVNGDIPAEKPACRWEVEEHDLPAIVEQLRVKN